MRLRIAFSCVAAVFLASNAVAAGVTLTDRISKEIPLYIAGSFWIDNPVGSIEIYGSDIPGAVVTVTRTLNAVDKETLKEAREQTVISFEGDPNVALVRTLLPPVRHGWTCSVSYSVRVPRTVHVKVAAKLADQIRLMNISGNVTVKAFSGTITLDNVTGPASIDTINGRVVYQYRQKPIAHAQIQAVNADIDVFVPPDSSFNWIVDTIRGDILTNLPLRVTGVAETQFRGGVNAPGGPTLTLQTILGTVRILAKGPQQSNPRSIRQAVVSQRVTVQKTVALQPSQRIQLPFVDGPWFSSTSVADIAVGEIRGPAHVETRAGEIELGVVWGECSVVTLGGPLNLGDIMGPLTARTGAGDILIRAARDGGRIWSGGGIIRVLYTGGPTSIESGGGDIVVRQAAGPINASTRSGDISITADPNQKTQKIQARTDQGNVILNVNPRFAADIDATVMTSDPDSNAIHSDFNLTIRRDRVGNRTRVRATGKVNGGGEHVELYAEDGDIHITTQSAAPVTVMTPVQ